MGAFQRRQQRFYRFASAGTAPAKGEGNHLVAAISFGFIKAPVGTGYTARNVAVTGCLSADTEAHGYWDFDVVEGQGAALNFRTQLFGNLSGLVQGCFGQQKEELFPAPAADDIFAAQIFLQDAGDVLQDLVTAIVAMLVIDTFEMIDIPHDHGERPLKTGGTIDLPLQELLEKTAIHQFGQGVEHGEFPQSG